MLYEEGSNHEHIENNKCTSCIFRYFEQWFRFTTLAVNPETIEPLLKTITLPYLSINAKRVGGTCVEFVDTWGSGNYWICASRLEFDGNQSLFWEYTNGSAMYKWEVDIHGSFLRQVDQWGVDPAMADPWRIWQDGEVRWRDPWVWEEGRPDGSTLVFTELGQRRAMVLGGTRVTLSLWMQDIDWSKMLSQMMVGNHELSLVDGAAFLFGFVLCGVWCVV